MGCIVSSIGCCFCSAAASFCCACLPSCKSSTSSRAMYSLILIITTLLAAIALIPEVRSGLAKIPALCTPFKIGSVATMVSSGLNCDVITGYGAVYRLCFATTMFFLLFSIIMIRVRSSNDPRARIQNGFWFFKYLVWFALVIAAFFIPVEGFTEAWMVVGMIGGSVFILIQLILLVDFAHSWNESWVSAYESDGEKCYAIGLVAATGGFYVASLVGVGLLYHFYAGAQECGLNKAMISLNLILCFIVSTVSIWPKVRERLQTSGVLQSSLVTCYVIYLTWSGMTNNTNPSCNPLLPYNRTVDPTSADHSVELKFDWHVAVGLMFLVLSVVYSSFRSSSPTAVGKFTVSGLERTTLNENGPGSTFEADDKRQVVWDDEEDGVTYVYSMFHFMLLLATLYVMVTLTNWLKPENDLKSLTANASSYWIRIVSSWVCLLLYLWTMLAPLIFPNREF